MRVEARDWRPPSILRGSDWSAREVAAGALFMLGAHVAVPLAVGAVAALLAAAGLVTATQDDAPPEEEAPPLEVIQAKFVKLGRPLPKRRLPNKEVPTSTQAPPKPSDKPSPFGKQVEPPPDAAVEMPLNADDLIAVLGNKADELSKRKNAWDQEGDLSGIEEGTEKAGEGDIYAGLLYGFFRRGWVVPTSIPDAELANLKCTVEVEITENARVGAFRVTASSGNADFDDSVRLRVSQAEGAQLPTPPENVAAQYLGRAVSLRFLGRHAGR